LNLGMLTSPGQSPPTRVRSASRVGEDVVFTFSMEMLEDAVRREFCRPPDQTLLALARDERIGRLLVADPWRSYAAAAARRRSLRLTGPVTIGGRTALRVRPHRLRRPSRHGYGRSRERTACTALCSDAPLPALAESGTRRQVRGARNVQPVRCCVLRRAVDPQGRLLRPRRLGYGRRSWRGRVRGVRWGC
jgi:hypothetical protein